MSLDFAQLLEQYRPLLSLQLRRMHVGPRLNRRFDSSDIVQETMLQAHLQWQQFHGTTEEEFLRWLQRILKNKLIDRIRMERSEKRDPAREEYLNEAVEHSLTWVERQLSDPNTSPSQQAMRRETLLRLAAVVEQLPSDQREVFVQRDLMDCPIAEIATRLEKTEKAVAGLLWRARQQVRTLLGPDWGISV